MIVGQHSLTLNGFAKQSGLATPKLKLFFVVCPDGQANKRPEKIDSLAH